MKRIITVVALMIAFSIASGSECEAGKRRYKKRRSVATYRNNNGGGFFSRLMEIERRKNAWLRATFFGG